MTDEQLEQKLSEEFEKWMEAELYSIKDGCYGKAIRKFVLPLMKKVEELKDQLDEDNCKLDSHLRGLNFYKGETVKLQKENEELGRQITEWKKVKDVFLAEVRKLKKENEELRKLAEWTTRTMLKTDPLYHYFMELKEIRTKLNLDKEGEK